MNEQVMQWLQALKPLAEKLGTTSEHVYGVLVTQGIVTGVVTLVQVILCATFAAVAGRFILKQLFNKQGVFYDRMGISELGFVCSLIGGLATFAATVLALTNIGEAATGLINPEYLAIKEIMATVRGK